MDEVNKSNFIALITDYQKISEDITSAKNNNTILTLVKDNNVESLHDLEEEFTEIMNYNIKLIEFF